MDKKIKKHSAVGSQLLELSIAVIKLGNNVMSELKTLFKMCIAGLNARCKDDATAD